MTAIARNDLRHYRTAPQCYIFAALYFAVLGYSFASSVIINGSAGCRLLFSGMYGILILVFPFLTQGAFPFEKSHGTYDLLLSSPVSTLSIVLGKFLGCFTVFALSFLLSSVFGLIICLMGIASPSEVFTCYLGAFLLGVCFISVGLFISAMCDRAVHGWLFTALCLSIFRFLAMLSSYTADSTLWFVIRITGLFNCFATLNSGVIDAYSIVYFLSFSVFLIFLACKVIDKRKWGRGDAI